MTIDILFFRDVIPWQMCYQNKERKPRIYGGVTRLLESPGIVLLRKQLLVPTYQVIRTTHIRKLWHHQCLLVLHNLLLCHCLLVRLQLSQQRSIRLIRSMLGWNYRLVVLSAMYIPRRTSAPRRVCPDVLKIVYLVKTTVPSVHRLAMVFVLQSASIANKGQSNGKLVHTHTLSLWF